MALGTSIFLIAVGAVLAFALDRDVVSVFNVNIIGYILMAVGVLGLILSFVINSRRSNTQHRTVIDDRRLPPDPPVGY
jgi:heme/copper-type cytochrome/quinol oxidase subunit 1